jgi:hypothetical protein
MIAKGTTHDNGARLARYLVTGKEGERAELLELRGFAALDIVDAFRSVHVIAGGTKCQQPFFHVQVRNPETDRLSRDQWKYTANRIEGMLGLKDQPRAIAFHIDEKTGEEHVHIAWSRIDDQTMTAKALPFFKERLKKLSRELEMHFGITLVPNERDSSIKYAPTRAEDEQARRLGLDPHVIRDTIRDCYERSDCGRSFEVSLAEQGMVLARGERRDFVVIDQAGGMHALGKRLLGVSAAQTRERLSDLPREQLPNVEQAKEFVREQTATPQQEKTAPVWDRDRDDLAWQNAIVVAAIEKAKEEDQKHRAQAEGSRHEADRATVADHIAWEEKLEQAAIEKEKIERRFVEPERGAQPVRPELTGPAGAIWEASQHSDNAQAFMAALADRGIDLARATRADAVQSQLDSAEARIAGYWKPTFREGEIVAVTEQGQSYCLTPRNTGKDLGALEKFMGGLQETLPSIADVQQQRQEQERQLAAIKAAAEPELNQTAGNIRLAYNLASGPEAFREFLEQGGLTAVRVTALDIHERDSTKAQTEKNDIIRMLHSPEHIWMLQTGGSSALSPELLGRAEEAYDIWLPKALTIRPDPFNFPAYVDYVQEKWCKLAADHAIDLDAARQQPPPPEAQRRERGLSGYAREGDIVILDKWGNVYELTDRTTGDTRQDAQAVLAGIGALSSIEDSRRALDEQRRSRKTPEAGPDLGKTAADIRLAYNLTDGPQAFKEMLEQSGLTVARAVWQDMRERDSIKTQEDRDRAMRGWNEAKPEIINVERSSLPSPEPEKRSSRLSDYAREGDVVVLDKWGNIYELTNRTTGDTRQAAQAALAGIGNLPAIRDARHELEEKRKRPMRSNAGPSHGGLVANQMWALRRIQDAEQQRREQQRREEEGRASRAAQKTSGEVDPQLYLTDPEYRRQVKAERSFKTPQERKVDRENDRRAAMEQPDRQR